MNETITLSEFDKFEQTVTLSSRGNEAFETDLLISAWNAALDAVLEIIPDGRVPFESSVICDRIKELKES